jgi:hypothetical protein
MKPGFQMKGENIVIDISGNNLQYTGWIYS